MLRVTSSFHSSCQVDHRITWNFRFKSRLTRNLNFQVGTFQFRVTRRPQGLPKCESLAQPLSGSSKVRVTGSAPARSARGYESGRPRRGPPQPGRPARVTPGLSSQSWFTRKICLNMGGAGDEALNSWRHDTTTLTPGSRPVIGVTWPLLFEET